MGLQIKKKGNKYQMKSTVSDERLHDELWISENEAKKTLIIRQWENFVDESIKIFMDFPSGYQINGLFVNGERSGLHFLMDNDGDKIDEKFDELCKELDIRIDVGK